VPPIIATATPRGVSLRDADTVQFARIDADQQVADLTETISAKVTAGELDDAAQATIVKLAAPLLTVSSHVSEVRVTVEIGEIIDDYVTIEVGVLGRGPLLAFDARRLAGVLNAYADLAEARDAQAARFAELAAQIEAGPQPQQRGGV
jgi:hypothetical protein